MCAYGFTCGCCCSLHRQILIYWLNFFSGYMFIQIFNVLVKHLRIFFLLGNYPFHTCLNDIGKKSFTVLSYGFKSPLAAVMFIFSHNIIWPFCFSFWSIFPVLLYFTYKKTTFCFSSLLPVFFFLYFCF